jgi:hypothetical protein
MPLRDRRNFLKGGSLAVGILAAEGCAVPGRAADSGPATPVHLTPSATTQVASFGWEICNLNGNGANTYVKVQNNMVLETVNADMSAAIVNGRANGFAEILCQGSVSRQAPPTFSSSPQVYVDLAQSPDFGSVTPDNPDNLSLLIGGMVQDQFLSVILKTWVPPDGTACHTARQVLAYPNLNLNAGDYLVFHMDHSGASLDAEMQIVLTYTLR